MAETSTLGLYVGDLVQEADNGMSVFEFLELIAGYAVQSNMEKIDNAMNVIKNKLSNYTSENVYITDHQKEGIENKQSEFNWNKNSQIEYIAKLLGGHEKCVLTVENTNITNDKSDILFTVTQGFSKLNNTATSGISEIQLAKSLLCERIMLDIKNDNDNIVYLTVYITVNGVQTTTQMTVPAKASVQKSFYNSIVRDLDSNSTIKFQAQTDGLPLIINSGSKAQYDYIDIDKISNLGDNFSDIIDNVYNEFNNREMEVGTVVLNNTKQYPFTNAEQTITLAQPRDNLDYVVHTEIANADGSCELSPIYDKQLNAFKLNYVGSASAVTVKYYVTGGLE